jgi:hypothetical protein
MRHGKHGKHGMNHSEKTHQPGKHLEFTEMKHCHEASDHQSAGEAGCGIKPMILSVLSVYSVATIVIVVERMT